MKVFIGSLHIKSHHRPRGGHRGRPCRGGRPWTNLGYSRRSLRRYRTIWQRLIAFAHQEALGDTFSEDLAVRFLEVYRLRADETIEPSDGWRKHVVFATQVLATFVRDARIERCHTDVQKVQIPPR